MSFFNGFVCREQLVPTVLGEFQLVFADQTDLCTVELACIAVRLSACSVVIGMRTMLARLNEHVHFIIWVVLRGSEAIFVQKGGLIA